MACKASSLHFSLPLPPTALGVNLVERWFAELSTKWLHRGVHTSVDHLIESMNTWIKTWNDKPRPFIWKKPRRRHPQKPSQISEANS